MWPMKLDMLRLVVTGHNKCEVRAAHFFRAPRGKRKIRKGVEEILFRVESRRLVFPFIIEFLEQPTMCPGFLTKSGAFSMGFRDTGTQSNIKPTLWTHGLLDGLR